MRCARAGTTRLACPYGLYAITASGLNGWRLLQGSRAVLRVGVDALQLRDKRRFWRNRLSVGRRLQRLCQQHHTPLIINDSPTRMHVLHADGVHLGRDDPALARVRQRYGRHCLIGVSCYADLTRARQALRCGASYVAFGRFFASQSKPQAAAADPSLLNRARHAGLRPCVAIGGIQPEHALQLRQQGADSLAVIAALDWQCRPGPAGKRFLSRPGCK